MLEEFDLSQMIEPLLDWFDQNKRQLPWREGISPYHTWVSEIMLQQTRVEAVKPYYARFLERLPEISDLAACPEDELLKLWEGLGYYSRVRNMQKAARQVMEEYGGELPRDVKALNALSGIGSYTAGAIASMAFGIPEPAVDGNAFRLIFRLSEDDSDIGKQKTKKKLEDALRLVMPNERPGDFNQAIMDLGALVCLPSGQPLCDKCPLSFCCQARKDHLQEAFPVKAKAKPRKIEEMTVFLICRKDQVILKKRPNKGLLAGLYELPSLPGKLDLDQVREALFLDGYHALKIVPMGQAKHIFSHIEWHMTGYRVQIDELEEESGLTFVDIEEARNHFAIPTAFSYYWKML